MPQVPAAEAGGAPGEPGMYPSRRPRVLEDAHAGSVFGTLQLLRSSAVAERQQHGWVADATAVVAHSDRFRVCVTVLQRFAAPDAPRVGSPHGDGSVAGPVDTRAQSLTDASPKPLNITSPSFVRSNSCTRFTCASLSATSRTLSSKRVRHADT